MQNPTLSQKGKLSDLTHTLVAKEQQTRGGMMEPNSVLLVCDDSETGYIWTNALQQRQLEVVLTKSVQEALDWWGEKVFTLIIIDVHTSQLDGIGLCRQLRPQAINPILLLTPKNDEACALQAYRAGVDECVIKPISPSLFLAKVTAWLRRSWTVAAEALTPLETGCIRLVPAKREALTENGSVVKLTNLEFRLLHVLICHQGCVVDTDTLVERVWGYTGGGDSSLLKNVVYRLRRKLEPDPSEPSYIQTVAGVGYSLQAK